MTQGDRASISKSLLKSKLRAEQDQSRYKLKALNKQSKVEFFNIHHQHPSSKVEVFNIHDQHPSNIP
jgi:hypothetical protein